MIAGLSLGLGLSLWQFISNLKSFKKIITLLNNKSPVKAAVRSAVALTGRELLLLLALYLAMKLDRSFFTGVVAGTLTMPMAVLVRGFTAPNMITDLYFSQVPNEF